MSVEDKLQTLQELAEQLYESTEQETVDESVDEVKAVVEEQQQVEESTAEPEQLSAGLQKLFEGQELTEEFKTAAIEIFEAAVKMRVDAEVERLEALTEQFKQELAESFDKQQLQESVELKESLVDKVDGYLGYIAEQWMEKNKLALERGIKADMFESFMSGMREVFEEHNFNIPEEEIEILEELQTTNQELEQKVDDILAENVGLKQTLKEIAKQMQIQEASEGLTDLDVERFVQLAEELSFDNEDVFSRKLSLIRENFFKKEDTSSPVLESTQSVNQAIDDDQVLIEESVAPKAPQLDPNISAYVSALSRIKL